MTQEVTPAASREGLRFLAVADLNVRDFLRARNLAGFARWAHFEDFQLEREALALSYEAAGVAAPRQRVPLAAFERWRRLTGAPLDADGLDEFAAHWRFRATRPDAPARGRFGAPGDPERNPVEADGAQIILVREDAFNRWRPELSIRATSPDAALDAYATQVVACCLSSGARASRSTMSAA